MFKLTIATDHAAFDDGNDWAELARLLRETAERLENECPRGILHDINGNRVGMFDVKGAS